MNKENPLKEMISGILTEAVEEKLNSLENVFDHTIQDCHCYEIDTKYFTDITYKGLPIKLKYTAATIKGLKSILNEIVAHSQTQLSEPTNYKTLEKATDLLKSFLQLDHTVIEDSYTLSGKIYLMAIIPRTSTFYLAMNTL